MNVNANSLLDASETEAQPRERRKKQAFRFGKDRRKQASLSIGIEISPSGLAFSLFRPQAKQDAVVVEYYPFSDDKGAWSCEWLSEKG